MAKKYTRHEIPNQLQTDVMVRMMGEKGVRDFYEQYKQHITRRNFNVKPSESDIRLARVAQECGGFALAARKVGVSEAKVHQAVSRVTRYKFFVEDLKGKK